MEKGVYQVENWDRGDHRWTLFTSRRMKRDALAVARTLERSGYIIRIVHIVRRIIHETQTKGGPR